VDQNTFGIRIRKGNIFFLIPLIFLFLFFYFPLGSILSESLSLDALRSILTNSYYLRVIGFTFYQAGLSTLFAVLLGLPGAYLLARYSFPGKRIVKSVTTIPFVLPSILVVLGFVLFFGNNGILNRGLMALMNREEPVLRVLYSMKAIILAHGFYNFPVSMRLISSVWEKVSPGEAEAARTLGAGRARVFFTVTLPQILPGIAAAAALIFLFCFLSFAVVLVLGGGPKFTTLEVEVYRLAKVSVDFKTAGTLALIGSVLSLLVMYLYIRAQSLSARVFSGNRTASMKPLKELFRKKGGFLAVLYLVVLALVIAAPLGGVILQSFQHRSGWAGDTGFSLHWYRQLLEPASPYGRTFLTSLKNSLLFGISTVAFSLFIGTLIALFLHRRNGRGSRVMDALFMLPMGISPVILGLGYLKSIRFLPDGIEGAWIFIVLAHTVVAYPFVVRAVGAVIKGIDPALEEAARTLGAGRTRVFVTVILPLIRPGLLAGAAFAFAISAGEMNATIILSGEKTMTLPIAMYRMISSYNFFGACVMGVFLMILCSGAFFLIERFGGIGE